MLWSPSPQFSAAAECVFYLLSLLCPAKWGPLPAVRDARVLQIAHPLRVCRSDPTRLPTTIHSIIDHLSRLLPLLSVNPGASCRLAASPLALFLPFLFLPCNSHAQKQEGKLDFSYREHSISNTVKVSFPTTVKYFYKAKKDSNAWYYYNTVLILLHMSLNMK